MKYDDVKGNYKKYDFVELETKFQDKPGKCLLISITKDIIKVAPILEDKTSSAICPIVAMPYDIISTINKMDDHFLLFYSDLNNSYIEKAILSKNNNRRANAKI